MSRNEAVRILVADDDEDDRMLIADAFDESLLKNPVDFVKDGEDLMQFLRKEGPYEGNTDELPGIILLDLNMPKKDGRIALKEIREDPSLRNIPIIVLTTSKSEEDILKTYGLGVNSFITKPVTFDRLVDVVKVLGKYWIEIVAIPANT